MMTNGKDVGIRDQWILSPIPFAYRRFPHTIAAVLMVATLFACATPYGGKGFLGGFTDSQIDQNTFSVSVDTNGFTSQQTTSMHAFYRAAELTVEHGFDYFVIADDASTSTLVATAMPGDTLGSTAGAVYSAPTSGRTPTTYAPTTVAPVFPNSTLIIRTFKGSKPERALNTYDARAVMKYLGSQIGIEQDKKP